MGKSKKHLFKLTLILVPFIVSIILNSNPKLIENNLSGSEQSTPNESFNLISGDNNVNYDITQDLEFQIPAGLHSSFYLTTNYSQRLRENNIVSHDSTAFIPSSNDLGILKETNPGSINYNFEETQVTEFSNSIDVISGDSLNSNTNPQALWEQEDGEYVDVDPALTFNQDESPDLYENSAHLELVSSTGSDERWITHDH